MPSLRKSGVSPLVAAMAAVSIGVAAAFAGAAGGLGFWPLAGLALAFVITEGFTVLTLKLTDTYGPADRRGKLVSALLQAQREGRRLDLSPGEQTLNLLHVDDVLSGSRAALDRIRAVPPHTREAFALRGPETLSLRDLVARIERLGARPVPVAWGARPYRPREVMRPWIGSLLPGWSAAIGLDRGLTELIAAQ